MRGEVIDTDWLRAALLPELGPPEDIHQLAVPIWCEQSLDELAEQLGAEYPCGFADGFRAGVVMAMLRPEWAQGFYVKLREYYLTTHSEEDLKSWEHHAEETAQVMPVALVSILRDEMI